MIVYSITNTVNGKRYIGITTKSLQERWRNHYNQLSCGIGPAIKKYGKDNFIIESLDDTASSLDELIEKEIHYISLLKPEYNRTKGGQGLWGFKHSEKTKQIISEKNKGHAGNPTGSNLHKWREENGSYWTGRNLTHEHRSNKSKSMKDFYNSEKGQENRRRISTLYKERGIKPPMNKHTAGTIWWNNGIINKRSPVSPGDDFVRGRIGWKNRDQNADI